MTKRITIPLAALTSLALLAVAAFAATTSAETQSGHGHGMKRGGKLQERYLYVSTVAQSATDPDFIAVVGADPRRKDFGKIVNRDRHAERRRRAPPLRLLGRSEATARAGPVLEPDPRLRRQGRRQAAAS